MQRTSDIDVHSNNDLCIFAVTAILILWIPHVSAALYLQIGTIYGQQYTNITEVPPDIPDNTTTLYLGFNNITKLKRNDFVHLTMLKELFLQGNGLREIENGSFNRSRDPSVAASRF